MMRRGEMRGRGRKSREFGVVRERRIHYKKEL